MKKQYLLNRNDQFSAIAETHADGRIYRVTLKVNGYWGSGITVHGCSGHTDEKELCRIEYASGGYETDPKKFKVYDNDRMNIIRAENFGEAMKYAAYLAYWIDNGQTIGSYRLPFEEEITAEEAAA